MIDSKVKEEIAKDLSSAGWRGNLPWIEAMLEILEKHGLLKEPLNDINTLRSASRVAYLRDNYPDTADDLEDIAEELKKNFEGVE